MLGPSSENYGGGPVGLETLAATIGEESVTLEDVYEPYLMQLGFLTRTPRGRCATKKALRTSAYCLFRAGAAFTITNLEEDFDMGRLFGTDGIRGIVGETLTAELAYRVGQAITMVLTRKKGGAPTITIGKDTRISSDMLESAPDGRHLLHGRRVMPFGTIPTPQWPS